MARLIDADALKICLQDHYGAIEQDCSIMEEFADGAISGIDAAMFEIDAAPTIPAISVEWLKQQFYDNPKSPWANECRDVYTGWLRWQKEQKEQEARSVTGCGTGLEVKHE